MRQTVARVSAIERMRQAFILVRVFWDIGVKKIYRHPVTADAVNVILPAAQPHRPALDSNRDPFGQLRQEVLDDPFSRKLFLYAFGIQFLTKVALAM